MTITCLQRRSGQNNWPSKRRSNTFQSMAISIKQCQHQSNSRKVNRRFRLIRGWNKARINLISIRVIARRLFISTSKDQNQPRSLKINLSSSIIRNSHYKNKLKPIICQVNLTSQAFNNNSLRSQTSHQTYLRSLAESHLERLNRRFKTRMMISFALMHLGKHQNSKCHNLHLRVMEKKTPKTSSNSERANHHI